MHELPKTHYGFYSVKPNWRLVGFWVDLERRKEKRLPSFEFFSSCFFLFLLSPSSYLLTLPYYMFHLSHHQLITTCNCKSCQVCFGRFLVFWFLFVCETKEKVKKEGKQRRRRKNSREDFFIFFTFRFCSVFWILKEEVFSLFPF